LSKRRLKNKDDNSVVIVKPIAYYKMLVHVLRFGNKVRDPKDYKEVMGMLIGHNEEKDNSQVVIIEDAVPISHGGSIEVDFAPEDYVTFATIDAEFAEKNWFTVGWYHSHPALQIFFSGTDINNQLGWQTPNPNAIGIVFDHVYLENPDDLGFRTFRLDDPSKSSATNYHEVKTIVEPPDDIDFYYKLIDLINCVHSKDPPILEINEVPDPFGEISFPRVKDLLAKKPELELEQTISSLQHAISKLLQFSLEPLLEFLNTWSQQIVKSLIDKNVEMRKDLITIKENLSQKISNLRKNFKSTLTEGLSDLETYFEDKFESFEEGSLKFKNLIDSMKDELKGKIEQVIQKEITDKINGILKKLDQNSMNLAEINQNSMKYAEKLEKQHELIENVAENVDSIEKKLVDEMKILKSKLEEDFGEKIDHFTKMVPELNKDSQNLLSNLNEVISNLKTSNDLIQKKIKSLTKEKKDLLNEIKKLKP
jgi:proteasome lid subunit RPN8/RPN11